MDDSLSLRALGSISVNMAHYIVANFLLPGLGNIVVDVVLVSLEFFNLLICNRKSKFLLYLCKGDPKSPPGPEFHIRRKNILHLLTCIPL